jgi:hypothetical protein
VPREKIKEETTADTLLSLLAYMATFTADLQGAMEEGAG